MTDILPDHRVSRAGRPSAGAWYALIVLVMIGFMYNLSRQVIVLVTEPLKRDLLLSDTQIGMLNGLALSLVAALAVFPLGWLCDRADRKILLAVCIAIWLVGTAGFGLAQSFGALFAFAMGIAVLEAILGPITYSIIPDLFPRERWISVNYLFYVLSVVGVSVGLTAAGAVMAAADGGRSLMPEVAGTLASWRLALIVVAAVAPVAILSVLLMPLSRPARPAGATRQAPVGLLAYFRTHARSLIGVFFGFGIVYSANGVLMIWLPPAISRVFGVPPSEVGMVLGLVLSICVLAGVILSAALVRWLRLRHGAIAPLHVAQLSVALAAISTLAFAFAPSPTWLYAAAGLKTVFVTACLSLSPAILQFIAPGHMRGRVIALGGLVSILFMALSPAVVGFVSDRFFPQPHLLLRAIVVVSVPCFLTGILLLRFGSATLPATFTAADES
ncbi:MFS transporter [Allosphingosinicella indica]|uniref:Predicted arabinose efflux permease, MFS family n=1 Tax=Allosphingosinicella indica TaxID=941907 RepID=A0A1X7FZX9_9SPHN|nr:MFS transporter [Allosphingosinicella indica]SMF61148.1 Predicted arabinose efflux permease, MFS family [Allosphingosinicella indica]